MSVHVPLRNKLTRPSTNVEPFVFAFVIVQSGATARWSDVEKRRELPASLLAIEQYVYCVAKRMQRAAFVRAYQKRTGE